MQELNFEEYLEKITKSIEKLNDENISLNDSLRFYKEGMENLQKAQKMLENAQITCNELKAQYEKEAE
ncbi:MAG: exodeoxyribonuclease VII small subunit [Helicobacter sp.]|nr:exodeoxyribonuclease VII small subunit [Helicobacteraceae bacterium]MDY3113831.1 exodeoxyribonuclease VII small subunit [Helicobacter sp.]